MRRHQQHVGFSDEHMRAHMASVLQAQQAAARAHAEALRLAGVDVGEDEGDSTLMHGLFDDLDDEDERRRLRDHMNSISSRVGDGEGEGEGDCIFFCEQFKIGVHRFQESIAFISFSLFLLFFSSLFFFSPFLPSSFSSHLLPLTHFL